MIIKQLSVFLENKTGRINEVTRILGEEGVNLSAFSMAETADFGILRVIVSDPDKALEALKKHHFGVSLTDVVCLNCPNTPGALAKALGYLSDENVFIEYMYAFAAINSSRCSVNTRIQFSILSGRIDGCASVV